MANFVSVRNQINSMEQAAQLLAQIQAVYRQAQFAKTAIDLYSAGTNPTFNQAVNAIFTAGERSQLATMLTQLNSLVTAWQANHQALLDTEL